MDHNFWRESAFSFDLEVYLLEHSRLTPMQPSCIILRLEYNWTTEAGKGATRNCVNTYLLSSQPMAAMRTSSTYKFSPYKSVMIVFGTQLSEMYLMAPKSLVCVAINPVVYPALKLSDLHFCKPKPK